MRHAARGSGSAPVGQAEAGSAGRASRARFDQLPYLIVLAGVVLALFTIHQGAQHVRGGTLVMAGVLLIAALARCVLPDYRAGLLASRRRLWDVAAFVLLGSGLLVAALVLPTPS